MHRVGRSEEHFGPGGIFPSPGLMMSIAQSWPALAQVAVGMPTAVTQVGTIGTSTQFVCHPVFPYALYPSVTQTTLNHLRLMVSPLVLVRIPDIFTVVTASDDVWQ